MSKDLGQEVIDFMFEQLQIDLKWSVREERGFKWWAGNLAQSITVEESKVDLGLDVYKLQARTGVLKDINPDQKFYDLIAEMMRFSTLSGLTFNPDDKSRLEMVTTMWVHDDNRPLVEFFFVMSSILQNVEAHIMANTYSESFSAEIDLSAHPTSGLREETDGMLEIITDVIRPKGEEPSSWLGDEMDGLRNLINNAPDWFSMGDESSLSAEYPYPGDTSLLTISTSESNPRLGNGLLVLLQTRKGDPDGKTALDWNFNDHYGEKPLQSFGSWCVSETGLTYTSFLPNAMFKMGATANVGLWMMQKLMYLHTKELDY